MILGSNTLSETPLASTNDFALSSYPGDSYLTILISDVDVTEMVKLDATDISISINNARELKLQLIDEVATHHYQPGESVVVMWNGTRIFAGSINNINEISLKHGYPGIWGVVPLVSDIECIYCSKVLDKIFNSETYADTTIQEIIDSIIYDETTLNSLDGISIEDSYLLDFPIDKITFDFNTISEVLDRLTQGSGLDWYVDPYKVIKIFSIYNDDASIVIGDGNKNYRNLRFSNSLDQYRNVQWVKAGRDIADPVVESFIGDGSTTTFKVAAKIAVVPTVKKNGTTQYVGRRSYSTGEIRYSSPGVAVPGWTQWMWEEDEDTISQNPTVDDTNNPRLTSSDTLEVTYQGYYDILITRRNESQITARKAIEGGSGIYENLAEDSTLDSEELAIEKAEKLLAQYSIINQRVEYEIDQYGQLPGQRQWILIYNHEIDGYYIISDVRIMFPRYDYIRCQVKAIAERNIEGWVGWWKRSSAFRSD